MTQYTLEALVDKDAVLQRMLESPGLKAKATVDAAMKIAAHEVETLVIEAVMPSVKEALQEALDMHCLTHGDADTLTDDNADEWHSLLDDAVDNALQPWSHILSADWLGQKTVDARLHEQDAVDELATAAAMEAYREIAKKRKPGQILSAVGIVKDDVANALMARVSSDTGGTATVEDVTANAAGALRNILDASELVGDAPDIMTVYDELDLMSDSDEGLAAGAADRLGVTAEDAAALRAFRVAVGAGAVDTLGEMYVTLTDDRNAYATPPPAAPAPAAPTQAAAPTTEAAPVAGELPSSVLKALKEYTPIKDKDMADRLGVSRATFNNKCNGRGDPITDPTQIATIRAVLLEHNSATANAITEIDAITA